MTDTQDNLPEAEGRNESNNEAKAEAPKKPEQAEKDRLEEQQEMTASDPEPEVAEVKTEATDVAAEPVEVETATPEKVEPEAKDESPEESLVETGTAIDPAVAEEKKQEEISEMTDDELEGDDHEDEEVHSDDDEHDEFAHHELELPDYAEYEPEKLVAEAEKLLKNEPVQRIKDHMDSIRKNILKQLNEEREEKLHEFLESGGVEIDFEF
ncbi:MAG: hypothetical protein ACPF9D_11310, partial [Owenweeksia sp.]